MRQAARAIGVGLVAAACSLGGCASNMNRAPVSTAQPVAELHDDFNSIYQDGDFYIAGQPTEAGLREMAARGVRVVVNIRPPETMTDASFDERAVAESLGMTYVNIPLTPSTFSAADVDAFSRALASTDDPVLLHCRSSNTSGGMWAAYLARFRGVPTAEAIERGRAAGLSRDDMIDAAERVAAEPRKK